MISDAKIKERISIWDHPTPIPFYTISQPMVTQVNDRGKETFVTKLLVTNNSDYDGIIQYTIHVGGMWNEDKDKRTNRKIAFKPHETKMLLSLWDEAPRQIVINTLISGNLPSNLYGPVKNIVRESRTVTEVEGDYDMPETSFDNPNEIIVDNEDSLLFVLSKPAFIGVLPQLLDEVDDGGFKYSGRVSWWRPPLQWTATTNAGYHGKYIRSANVIKSGDGSQTATWKVPVPTPGDYELYYWAFNEQLRWDRHMQGEYHFKIKQGEDEEEDAYVNVRHVNEEWGLVGVYEIKSDTVTIVLSNDSKIRTVTADAVKLIKR